MCTAPCIARNRSKIAVGVRSVTLSPSNDRRRSPTRRLPSIAAEEFAAIILIKIPSEPVRFASDKP
ncbi:unnamed protein product, partial [Haemonchus placei]|uniref:Uncharacterized protein n=1 Tax=Haemonchus placei TaxID=6290 RepID=A0A0N4X6W9_HAEPC